MTLQEFRDSLSRDEPPRQLSIALAALWWDAKGDWKQSHEVAGQDEGPPPPGCMRTCIARKATLPTRTIGIRARIRPRQSSAGRRVDGDHRVPAGGQRAGSIEAVSSALDICACPTGLGLFSLLHPALRLRLGAGLDHFAPSASGFTSLPTLPQSRRAPAAALRGSAATRGPARCDSSAASPTAGGRDRSTEMSR